MPNADASGTQDVPIFDKLDNKLGDKSAGQDLEFAAFIEQGRNCPKLSVLRF